MFLEKYTPVTAQEDEAMEIIAQRLKSEEDCLAAEVKRIESANSQFHLHVGHALELLNDVLVYKQTPETLDQNLSSAQLAIDDAKAALGVSKS